MFWCFSLALLAEKLWPKPCEPSNWLIFERLLLMPKRLRTLYSILFCNKAIILVFFQMHYNFSLLFLLRQNMPNSQLVHEKITPTVKLNLVAVNVLIKDTNYILCCTSLKYIFSLFMVLLQSESPSGISTKLHTAVASSNRDHPTRSLSYCLFTLHIYVCCS